MRHTAVGKGASPVLEPEMGTSSLEKDQGLVSWVPPPPGKDQ